jgi:hypothetical protein
MIVERTADFDAAIVHQLGRVAPSARDTYRDKSRPASMIDAGL